MPFLPPNQQRQSTEGCGFVNITEMLDTRMICRCCSIDSGQTEKHIPVTMPHTITDWVGRGFCVSSRSGVGVAREFKVTAFQPFFVSFTLPYSLVRAERVAIPVSVFNYLTAGCLQVVRLAYS